MAKIALAGGHSKKAPGAVSYLNEYVEDRKINDALIAELKKRGHTCYNCSNEASSQSAELAAEVSAANKSDAKLFCATHLNACKKVEKEMGVEVWYYKGSSLGKNIAEKMAADLSKLMDIPNRGAKATTSLYVLRKTNMTAVLPEICFVDSKGDSKAYNGVTTAKIASVMADAIEYGVGKGTVKKAASTATASTSFKSYKVKITASTLNVRAGAGTGYKVKTTVVKNQVFTIVSEKNGWGKLKSGAGWIKLSYTKRV